jgi:hypothetical protein
LRCDEHLIDIRGSKQNKQSVLVVRVVCLRLEVDGKSFIFVVVNDVAMATTLQIDTNSSEAIKFLEFARTLPFVSEEGGSRQKIPFGRIHGMPYTVEQLRARIAEAEEDYAAGQYIPHEAIQRKAMPR